MKLATLALGLFSISSVLTLAPINTNSVQAQCVQADIAVGYNISGSKQPTQRTNNVDMQSQGGCTGNSSVNVGVQGNVGGTGKVIQNRNSSHKFSGGSGNGSTVKIKVNPTVDVYNAADRLQK
jgi:hypothetical protein